MSRLLLGVACAVLCLAGASGHASAQTPALPDDATLSALTLSGVRLTPRFTGGTTSYTASVGYTVTRTTIAATPSDDNATIEYLDGNGSLLGSGGSIDVDLPVGETVIAVRVTAQDGVETETYSITVTRTAEDLAHAAGERSCRAVRLAGHLHHHLPRRVDQLRHARRPAGPRVLLAPHRRRPQRCRDLPRERRDRQLRRRVDGGGRRHVEAP